MSKRKKVDDQKGSWSQYDFSTSAKYLIEEMQKLIDEYGPEVHFSYESTPYNDDYAYFIMVPRLETDWEFNRRQVKNKKLLDKQRLRDINELHRLKKKLGET